jgi:hypothetical protein
MHQRSDGENSTAIVIKRQEIPLKCCRPETICNQKGAAVGPIEAFILTGQVLC